MNPFLRASRWSMIALGCEGIRNGSTIIKDSDDKYDSLNLMHNHKNFPSKNIQVNNDFASKFQYRNAKKYHENIENIGKNFNSLLPEQKRINGVTLKSFELYNLSENERCNNSHWKKYLKRMEDLGKHFINLILVLI